MEPATSPTAKRVLVLLTADCDGEHLVRELAAHGHDHRGIRIVAPLVGSRLSHFIFGDEHASRPAAEHRLAVAIEAFALNGIDVTGATGDSSPLQALDDEIATYHPDELAIVVHPIGGREWFEKHLPEEAMATFDLPVSIIDAVPIAVRETA